MWHSIYYYAEYVKFMNVQSHESCLVVIMYVGNLRQLLARKMFKFLFRYEFIYHYYICDYFTFLYTSLGLFDTQKSEWALQIITFSIHFIRLRKTICFLVTVKISPNKQYMLLLQIRELLVLLLYII